MRVLVTGKNGQVAQALAKVGAQDATLELVFIGRPEFDLAHPTGIDDLVKQLAPDVVVNAAAWTAVDDAETHRDAAFAANAIGAEAVARAAQAIDAPIIQISTDYVFAGDKAEPYVETDPTNPQGVYGASKLEGERRVAAANPKHVILRTAWVYSETGKNFLKTMLRVAEARDELSVVNDQIGTPTHADEIANGILKVAKNLNHSAAPDPDLYGVFHMTCGGQASWYDFAVAIFKASEMAGAPVATIKPVPSSAYPTPTKRPENSRLDCQKIATVHSVRLANWEMPIEQTVNALIVK